MASISSTNDRTQTSKIYHFGFETRRTFDDKPLTILEIRIDSRADHAKHDCSYRWFEYKEGVQVDPVWSTDSDVLWEEELLIIQSRAVDLVKSNESHYLTGTQLKEMLLSAEEAHEGLIEGWYYIGLLGDFWKMVGA